MVPHSYMGTSAQEDETGPKKSAGPTIYMLEGMKGCVRPSLRVHMAADLAVSYDALDEGTTPRELW